MHVGIALPYLEKGGTEEHALTLVGYLASQGIRVSVIAPAGPRDADLDRLPVRRLQFIRFDHGIRKAWMSYRAAVSSLVETDPPDVLHVHGAHELLLALPRKARCIPTVFTNHGYHGAGKALSYKTAAWVCNRRADRSVAVSQYEKGLMKKFGFDKGGLRLIHNGIAEPADPAPLPSSSLPANFTDALFRVGAIARLETAKGIEYLIRAMAQLKAEPIVCIIIGDGSLRGALEELANTLGVAGSVHFAGYIPNASAQIHHVDVLAVPSLEEPFGLVCVEAMACSKPVVASRVGGIPEIVVDNETGLLVPPGDDVRLADAILRLYRDAGLRERLGQAGRERYLAHFSIEGMGEAVLELYRELLAGVPRE